MTNQVPMHCGKLMIERKGKFGTFYGCANYPRCKHTVQGSKTAAKPVETVEQVIPTLPGSAEQEAFWNELVNGEHHIVLRARAGTGKTWSGVQAAVRLDPEGNYYFVAYNKRNADELAVKLPKHMKASTVHSFGLKAVTRAYGFMRASEWKTKNILDVIYPKPYGEENANRWHWICSMVESLVSKCKNMLVDANDQYELEELCLYFGITLNDSAIEIFDLTRQVLSIGRSRPGLKRYHIDFDDMVWLPVVNGLELPPVDILFVDEFQDANRTRQELVFRATRNGADRIVVIGDERQSMYGFAGADTDGMSRMQTLLGDTKRGVVEMPLTTNWRCGKAHIKLAQKLVPDINAHDAAPEGTIEVVDNGYFEENVHPGDMALCRVNAPLIGIAYSLIRANVPVTIQGRDIAKNLKTLINKLGRIDGKGRTSKDEANYRDLPGMLGKLDEFAKREASNIAARKSKNIEQALEQLADKVNCITELCEGMGSVKEVLQRIDDLFSDLDTTGMPKNKVVLSSVHRSKGFEAPRIWILKPELLPLMRKKMQQWEIEQEINILYVAITRVHATEDPESGKLYFVGPMPEILAEGK